MKPDPSTRLTIEQILRHPWTLSNYSTQDFSGIVTYQHSKENVADAEGSEELVPCETTMLPYISQMYQQELEQDLEQSGFLNQIEEDEEVKHQAKPRKPKIMKWIKNIKSKVV